MKADDQTHAEWDSLSLAPEHIAELKASAWTAEFAEQYGVRSITNPSDLPDAFKWCHKQASAEGRDMFPALLYTWRQPDGTKVPQLKPARETVQDRDGKWAKYLFGKGADAKIGVYRSDPAAKTVVICEGTKQAGAVACYLPDDFSVIAIPGISSYSDAGVPSVQLAGVKGRDVIIVPDADAEENPLVYVWAKRLGDACTDLYAANSAKYVRVADVASGKCGIDDVLGALPEGDRQATLLRLLDKAKNKPADCRPPSKRAIDKAKRKEEVAQGATFDGPVIHVDDQVAEVKQSIVDALTEHFDGILFDFGDAITQVIEGRNGRHYTEQLTDDSFNARVAEAAYYVEGSAADDEEGCSHRAATPSSFVLKAARSHNKDFPELEGVSYVPLIRADGTICTASGYDEDSKRFIDLPPELSRIAVPESPSEQDLEQARKTLHTWLGGFPWKDGSSYASAIAFGLTLLTRHIGWYDLCPLYIVDALDMGAGKGLLVDVLNIMAEGEVGGVQKFITDDDKQRAMLTAHFLSGKTTLFFDEAHEVGGASLAAALTALVWTDRKYQVSKTVHIPNQMVMASAGNQVQVSGDLVRRFHKSRLEPGPGHHEKKFAIADLRKWTRDNRCKILAAFLTMIRAWIAEGRPKPQSYPFRFGSYEAWQDVIGGILDNAGIDDFLVNVKKARTEPSFEESYWIRHLEWLAETFPEAVYDSGSEPTKPFSTRQVVDALDSCEDSEDVCPPGLTDTGASDFARKLGEAYSKPGARWREIGGRKCHVLKTGTGHGKSNRYAIERAVSATSESDSERSEATETAEVPVVAAKTPEKATEPVSDAKCTCGAPADPELVDFCAQWPECLPGYAEFASVTESPRNEAPDPSASDADPGLKPEKGRPMPTIDGPAVPELAGAESWGERYGYVVRELTEGKAS